MNSLYNYMYYDPLNNYSPLQHQLNQYQLQYQQAIPSAILTSNFFVQSPPSPPSPTKAVALAYAQQHACNNNSSPHHIVFQSQQKQIHQSETYIPATDYPSPRVDLNDSANLNGIMTENQVTTSSPPSFSSELHDTKPVTISGSHGSHEAYPSTPTTYV